jgi:hypothetical protein
MAVGTSDKVWTSVCLRGVWVQYDSPPEGAMGALKLESVFRTRQEKDRAGFIVLGVLLVCSGLWGLVAPLSIGLSYENWGHSGLVFAPVVLLLGIYCFWFGIFRIEEFSQWRVRNRRNRR